MKAGKWNYETHKYEDYELPEESALFETNMDKVVCCASCGKKMIYGNGITSKKIQNSHGFGYSICLRCYEMEYNEEQWFKIKIGDLDGE